MSSSSSPHVHAPARAAVSMSCEVEQQLIEHVAAPPQSATPGQVLNAIGLATRAQLARRWVAGQQADTASKARRVNYLSMEFLIGRSMSNAIAALGIGDEMALAAQAHAAKLEDLIAAEPDAALGNGGLGRLAACFLDSMATLELPSFGYGIRYEFGMFRQGIQDGQQVETPDDWLTTGSPWEFERPELDYAVAFGACVDAAPHASDEPSARIWRPAETVRARAYDRVVPGHGTERVSTLRLWRALAAQPIDLAAFNRGDLSAASAAKLRSEALSWVLYPNDSTPAGRELRLRQEYFFTSASLQDILARHLAEHGGLHNLADKVAIHLNDTHPAIAVAELMRLLVDLHGLPWNAAWCISREVFSYTNHTLMPEALETWPVALFQSLLPRHLDIICGINADFLAEAAAHRPGDSGYLRQLSLIDEDGERRVRMAHLAIVGSHKVNGVSALHSKLLTQTLFAGFASLWPGRFCNVTNGVTPRRWLAQANRGLSQLIDSSLVGGAGGAGSDWRLDLSQLQRLLPQAENAEFRSAFLAVKRANKQRLAAHILASTGIQVDPDSLFDLQVKRIHEYKRQLLNLLQVVSRYQSMLAQPDADWTPRTVIFAGKAASSYVAAKQIVRLIHDVAQVINKDERLRGRLKLVFVPNYGVSVAELLMPAADLSEQISTAGTEASGTGNMKLAMNGALTIGTDDGANIEIRQQVGADNIFIFGLSTEEVARTVSAGYEPRRLYDSHDGIRSVLDAIASGEFSAAEPDRYRALVDSLLGEDRYLLLADFDSYLAAQARVDALYKDPHAWARKAIANVAGMGWFSSDRAVGDYAREIWRLPARA